MSCCNCPECYTKRRNEIADPKTVLVTGTDGKERVYKSQLSQKQAKEALGHLVQPARIA